MRACMRSCVRAFVEYVDAVKAYTPTNTRSYPGDTRGRADSKPKGAPLGFLRRTSGETCSARPSPALCRALARHTICTVAPFTLAFRPLFEDVPQRANRPCNSEFLGFCSRAGVAVLHRDINLEIGAYIIAQGELGCAEKAPRKLLRFVGFSVFVFELLARPERQQANMTDKRYFWA